MRRFRTELEPAVTPDLPDHTGAQEYLGSPQPPARRRPRSAVLAAASLAVVAVLGAGGWGVAQLMGAGASSPATAIPADAVGYASVNLDPSLGQKVDALTTLKKFPALEKKLSLGTGDDLRRWLFDQATKDSDCAGVSYEKDIAPWIGDQVAVAAVPDGEKSAYPVIAVGASDEKAAKAAVAKLDACAGGDQHTGIAFAGGYALLTEKQAQATAAAQEALAGSLADDPDFQTWMKRTGDPGIITAYAAKDAPRVLADLQAKEAASMFGSGTPLAKTGAMYKGFEGMAAVVRFVGGGLETEVVAKGLPAGAAGTDRTGPSVADLPGSTAFAFSVGLPEGWLSSYLHNLDQVFGGDGSLEQMMKQGEAATGLKLPEDLQTLLGDGVSVSVDSSLDPAALQQAPDPSKVPVALRIKGDPAKIQPVLDRLTALAGPQARMLVVKHTDGLVVLGTDADYVDTLLSQGGLGSTTAFQDAVPNADRASSVLYLGFDAGNWAQRLADLAGSDGRQVAANLAPLQAVGMSTWRDDEGVQHGLLRITTD